MHLQKLIDVLKHFDEERLMRLEDYVRSPYFKTPPVCALLLNRLMPLHPNYMKTKMQWQKLGRRDKTLSTIAKQRNAATGLLKAMDGFIALEQWQKSKAEVMRHRLKGYSELQLNEKFDEAFKSQMLYIETVPEQDIDAFFEKHMLVEMSMQSFSAKTNRTVSNDIMPVVKTLDEYYALKKLRYLCEALNRQQVLGASYHAENIPSLLNILEPYINPQFPYVYLFVNVFRMMNENAFEESYVYYQMLKQYMEKRSDAVVPQSVKEAADYVLGCCLRWYSKGYQEAGDEYLWWIDWKIKNNVLLKEGKLMPVTFRNVVRIAVLGRKESSWIKDWIHTQISYLPKESFDTNFAYAQGLYHYSLKSYLDANRFLMLAQVKDDVVFNCNLRLWQWMCLYEYDVNDIELLYGNLLAFEKHLTRHKSNLKHLPKMFDAFISYAFQLIKSDVREWDCIYEEIDKQNHFAGKLWLMEQFDRKNKKPVRVMRTGQNQSMR